MKQLTLRSKGCSGILGCIVLASASFIPSIYAQDVDIPFEKFRLGNGLTVIVHEDHKAPLVAVNIWYHVGSKDEKPGKTGLAHLFEHLLFGGSENVKGRFWDQVDTLGATEASGGTDTDRTSYFETVPVQALDRMLFIESDRMGHFLASIRKEDIDRERGIVQNEMRSHDNKPYVFAEEMGPALIYPAGHPYSHRIPGSFEDLNAASLSDAQQWFKSYYGPNNAVLVLAGDITAAQAKEKVNTYFGHIPMGLPVLRPTAQVAKMNGSSRYRAEDHVAQARIYKVWNVARYGAPAIDYLDLTAGVLSQGRSSRFYRRLVYDLRIATDVTAKVDKREIGCQFTVFATIAQGHTAAEVEQALDEELARYLKDGPTDTEVERIRTERTAAVLRAIEHVGGSGGKADRLAESETYLESPAAWKASLKRIQSARAADLKAAANEWLSDGVAVFEVNPIAPVQPLNKDVDRSRLPDVTSAGDAVLPKPSRQKLSNGVSLVLVERHHLPLIEFTLVVNAGNAAEEKARAGTARLTSRLMLSGTEKRNALQIAEESQSLGIRLQPWSGADVTGLDISVLKKNLDPSLALLSDVILHPAFPQVEFQREQQLQLAAIEQEKTQPFPMAMHVMPPLLFGADHPYGSPATGTGTNASIRQITRDDVEQFYRTWLKPSNTTLIIVGDITMAEIQPKLEAQFGGWAKGSVPKKNVPLVQLPRKTVVYLLDKPDAPQSVILTGIIVPKPDASWEVALETMNNVFGGLNGRLNLNLREDKHWSYGAYAQAPFAAKGQRLSLSYVPVQTDKTKEAMIEVQKEIRGMLGDRPITDGELQRVKNEQVLRMAGQRETNAWVARWIESATELGLPDDFYDLYASRVNALRIADIDDEAKSVLDLARMIWLVIGDRKKIETDLRTLNFGEVRLIDADGHVVK